MVSKFYKISHKSLGNNSVKSYSGMYVRKACIYINVFDEKKLRRLKIYFLKGEESLSAEMEIVSTEMMLFRGMK